ncbi:MAG: hypothetical protein ABI474_01750 [Actinomycetota bacterium]
MTGPPHEQDALAAVRDALSLDRWDEALALLDADITSTTGSERLELRARAAYGAGDPEGSVGAWEALYRFELDAGDHTGAARAAAMVAMYLMIDTGLMSPIRGWLRRAERLVGPGGDTPVHAVVAMVRTYERLWCGDMPGAGANARLAIELGERHSAPQAVLIGTVATARLRIFEGNTDEGIEMLDDVAISLASGEVDAMTSGMAYCELICAAQGLALYDRAAEWTQAMEHWRRGAGFGGFSGRCRVHRAEMLRLSGPCDEAEQEALEACEELRPWMRREFGWPLTELGNIRLRKGDLPGADEAFVAAHENCWMPQPGLALLRLVQGEVGAAAAMIADALEHPLEVPSKERPPYGSLRRAPLLEAQVEIAVTARDVVTARRAADELRSIADTFHSEALVAGAALAQGRAALAEGDARGAVVQCERALVIWSELGGPYEAAVVRMTLAEARRLTGNEEGARMEWEAAGHAFEAFGAHDAAERALRAAETTAPRKATAPGPPMADNVFRCEGDTRTVTFDGHTALIHDLLGLRYLERLLAEPNREFHALDLVAVERGSLPVTRHSDNELAAHDAGHAGCHLDARAREAYKRRLLDIEEDIEDATEANDLGRVALAEADREFLVTELSRAVGLGGRPRLAAATAERARTSVTRTIRYAVARVAEHHPALGEHLRQAVATGTYCCYQPDPRLPTHWEV